jgi:hypothetical protein
MPSVPLENDTEVRGWDIFPVHWIGWWSIGIGLNQVCCDLMSKKIEVNPTAVFTPSRTLKNVAEKMTRGLKVSHWKGEMKRLHDV